MVEGDDWRVDTFAGWLTAPLVEAVAPAAGRCDAVELSWVERAPQGSEAEYQRGGRRASTVRDRAPDAVRLAFPLGRLVQDR